MNFLGRLAPVKNAPASDPQQISGSEKLCSNCSRLDISGLFDDPPQKTRRRKVGTIAGCDVWKAGCRLCRFFIQACELRYPREKNEALWNGSDGEIPLFLYYDTLPWYQFCAFEVPLPGIAYAWLGIGPSAIPRDSMLCVNRVPSVQQAFAFPKVRSPDCELKGLLDYEQLKAWLRTCEKRHDESCHKDVFWKRRRLKLFLIDVHTRHLKRAREQDQFVALSYVWGKKGRKHLMDWSWDVSSPMLESNDDVAKLPASLPQTVEDAMTLTQRLGERYLWVDAFCINQQNLQHQQEQIASMDLVYQCARLTIIALDGKDADAGLAGISRPLQKIEQPQVHLRAGSLMATFIPQAPSTYMSHQDPDADLPPWETRAWTIQERLLSPRCLIMDKHETTWVCGNEYRHSLVPLDPSPNPAESTQHEEFFWDDCRSIDLSSTEWRSDVFSNFFSIYSGRELTYEEDVLNACRGVLNHITEKTGMKFFQGLPVGDFLPFLLWKAHPMHCPTRRKGFPTWSWIGWVGRTELTYWLHDIECTPGLTEEGMLAFSKKKKGKRLKTSDATFTSPKPPEILSDLLGEEDSEVRIKSKIAKFGLKLVRKSGTALIDLPSSSVQHEEAIGDHWTLLNGNGVEMRDATGEYATFEATDYFFRVHPKTSRLLSSQQNRADLLYIKYWPFIRDSGRSCMWERDMVGALVLSDEDEQGKRMKIASLVLPLEDWLGAVPIPATVTLV